MKPFVQLAFAFVVFCYCLVANAQEKYFEKAYWWKNNHTGITITQDINEDYLVHCGYFRYGGDTASSALLNINKNGEILNLHLYTEDNYENIVRVVSKTNTGYLLTGFSQDFLNQFSQTYILWVDEYGNRINSYLSGSSEIENGIYTGFRLNNGSYLFGGFIDTNFLEPYVVKLNAFGQEEWWHIYNNYNYSNWVQDMLPDEGGGAYLLLQTNFWAGGSDMALLKIDSLGNIILEKNYDFNPYADIPDATDQHDGAKSIIRTSDGGFLITAAIDTPSVVVPQIGLYLYGSFGAVIKTDSVGNIEWTNFEHNGRNALPNAACQLHDSSYVACGSRYFPIVPGEPADQKDVELFKLDKNGNTLWTRFYGGAFNDYAFDMLPTPDDGFILCGRKEFIDYAADTGMAYVYVIKTNCMGLLTQPAAAFSYEPQGANEVQFTNLSLYAYPDSTDGGYYVWDFGDGSPPYLCGQGYAPCTGNTLTHQYPNSGTYTATLTAIVCSDTSTVQALIDTESGGGTVGTAENSPSRVLGRSGVVGVVVYPNPAQNTLFLANWQQIAAFKLYAISGVAVLGCSPVAGSQIGIAQLPAGLYIAEIQYKNGAIQRQKLLIHR